MLRELYTDRWENMKIQRSRYVIIVNIICLVLLIGTAMYLVAFWKHIPDKIPGHYNAAGEIDRYGSKSELIFIPLVGFILYAGITFLEKFPQAWNTGVKITEDNKASVYSTLKNMIVTIKLIMVLNFTFLTFNTLKGYDLPGWYLPVIMLAVFGEIIYFCVRLNKLK